MEKIQFDLVSPSVNLVDVEHDVTDFWQKEGIVEKYLHRNDASDKRFSFLDGPITANNPMGVHHAWGRTYKDLWQRFYTMMGYKGRYQNGFDCQGLWVEVEVEKELGVKNKKDIENLVSGDKKASIAKFVDLCKERVKKFSSIQTEQSKRLGYFMDWDHSYYTMSDENNYMIWYFLKTCHEKGWIYKGKDSVPWCPRCETAISQHEMLTEDYKELTHETVFLKLPISTQGWENTSLLVWTTTPWTIPANVGVGVNIKYTYAIWEGSDEKTEDKKTARQKIILVYKDAEGNAPIRHLKNKDVSVDQYIFGEQHTYTLVKEVSGKELLGLTYEAPFDHLPKTQEAKQEHPDTFHTVVDGSQIVVSEEGTGLLHVAPGAGKEDFDLGKEKQLSIISLINDDASYQSGMEEFTGKNAKKHPELIIDFLKSKGDRFLHKTMQYTHRYPACWRCKAELVWKVAEEWYIAMDRPSLKATDGKLTLREQMIETAKMIDWHPSFGLDRELDWLSNMHDWLISKKNRYWGLALPIYECPDCHTFEVIGSKEELKQRAISGWEVFDGKSPHKPYIDEVIIECSTCHKPVHRLDDVGNVWLDAGIVPFSTFIDPKTKKLSYTTDKTYWKEWFPVDFITESFPGQFKNWFYSMIAMSTVLEKRNPFKTVLGYASMLGEDGRPMHKSWGNSIEFNEGAEKIGADVMRWMFVREDPEQNILFGYKKADETRRKFHLMLWNIYNFFVTYASVDGFVPSETIQMSENVLDQWILSRLSNTTHAVTLSLKSYNPKSAADAIETFVSDVSLWYVRRSRDRIGPTVEHSKDKQYCYETLYRVLVELSTLLAPFVPYMSEAMYKNLTKKESVHLAQWPEENQKEKNAILEQSMIFVRSIVERIHAKRKEAQLAVRKPLIGCTVSNASDQNISESLLTLIKEETNIKSISLQAGDGEMTIELDTTMTPELENEGKTREAIRTIQQLRKDKKCAIDDTIVVTVPKNIEALGSTNIALLQKETLATSVLWGDSYDISISH
jgi:isoleucyl-tRNA synthetase